MAFADNLKRIRKEKGISQEELAELLDVSRQAVSKWEQGAGYPEVEKLLVLSKTLHSSLDLLMAGEIMAEESGKPSNDMEPMRRNEKPVKIVIPSFDGKPGVRCYKVRVSCRPRTKSGRAGICVAWGGWLSVLGRAYYRDWPI